MGIRHFLRSGLCFMEAEFGNPPFRVYVMLLKDYDYVTIPLNPLNPRS